MALVNPLFSEAGATPGRPLGWKIRAESSLVRLASFVDLDLVELGVERFNWFEPLGAEDGIFGLAIFDASITSGEALEDFDEGYIEGPWIGLWSEGFEEAAVASPELFDWTPEGWRGLWDEFAPGEIASASNTDFDLSGYITLWSEVASEEEAEFDGPTNVEVFNDWTPLGS